MSLTSLELSGFKSFAQKSELEFSAPITAIVGPNGSGKSNIAEAFRFVLGEQSMKTMRGKKGEDLIWSGSASASRANRAAVKVVFDNSKRLLDIDYDEVAIERVVFRDGTNEYSINGSKVRLKDVIELLAGANIGSSGHHIISQGESDRILSATPKERRAMIEDALGLRVYQYKKAESEKKLEKTEENRQQVESLRKENAPHLKFLEKQVEKIHKAAELKSELIDVYKEYLKREELYLTFAEEDLAGEREEPEKELAEVEKQLAQARQAVESLEESRPQQRALLDLEKELTDVREQKNEVSREMGKLEGQIAFEERRIEQEKRQQASEEGKQVPYRDVRELIEEIDEKAGRAQESEDAPFLQKTLRTLRSALQDFLDRHKPRKSVEVDESGLEQLVEARTAFETRMEVVAQREEELAGKRREMQQQLEELRGESHEAQRKMFELLQRQNELETRLAQTRHRTQELARLREDFKRELAEAAALIGREAALYKEYEVEDDAGVPVPLDELAGEDRAKQEERRRNLERMKIRLEEMGGAGADEILQEYHDVKERDAFLEREIADLERSAQSLRELIADLERELAEKFDAGLSSISQQFKQFFTVMFGGGEATLTAVKEKKRKRTKGILDFGDAESPEDEMEEDDEEEGDEGIEINVSLPNKRIKGLMMLSGGERALTSIALIFAMSQVNPPPFLILDETDAALDEANSRRYGDMIEDLAKQSQLILITHNRETMSRAGILYGITMGADGVSKLLSVKFEEGLAFAKQ